MAIGYRWLGGGRICGVHLLNIDSIGAGQCAHEAAPDVSSVCDETMKDSYELHFTQLVSPKAHFYACFDYEQRVCILLLISFGLHVPTSRQRPDLPHRAHRRRRFDIYFGRSI